MGFFQNLSIYSQAQNFLEQKVDGSEIEAICQEINTEEATKKLALSIAISYVTSAISQCEFKTFENNKSVKNTLYYLLNVNPNKNENPSQFKSKLMSKILINQEALVVVKNNEMFVADSFNREKNGTYEDVFYNVTVENDNVTDKIKANKVFYFKLEDTNITNLINSWNRGFGELLDYAYEKYKDRNAQKYKLIMDSTKIGDREFMKKYEETIKKQLEDFIKKRTAIYPQFRGYDLQNFNENSTGTTIGDVTGLKKEIFDTCAQAFKIPTQMMLGNVSNLSDVVNLFLTFSVDPFAKMIGDEFTRKTTTYDLWNSGNYVRVDTSTIQHIDVFANAVNIDKLISSGFNNIDEVRRRTNQDEIGSEFSQSYFITKNYAPIEDVLDGESDQKGGE